MGILLARRNCHRNVRVFDDLGQSWVCGNAVMCALENFACVLLHSVCSAAVPRLVTDYRAVLAPEWRSPSYCPPREEEPTQPALYAGQEQDVKHDEAEQFITVQDQCDAAIEVAVVDNTALSFYGYYVFVRVHASVCVHLRACWNSCPPSQVNSVYNPTFL